MASSKISDEGREIAGDEPYFIKNGHVKELVITQPEQLREFARRDVKGEMIIPLFFVLSAIGFWIFDS